MKIDIKNDYIIIYRMNWFLQVFKRTNESNRSHDESIKEFENVRRITIKTILDAKIIGDTLSVARDKVKSLIICPYEIDGVIVGHEQVYMNNRCNVAINDNIITKVISFG
jgi:hypothetical protein